MEREDLPLAGDPFPVQRSLPAVRLNGIPAGGQPEVLSPVAPVPDEVGEIALGHGVRRDAKRRDEPAMAGRLVVEGESLAVVADVAKPPFHVEPAGRPGPRRRGRPGGAVGRPQGVSPQQVLQVDEDELLVLLLVLEPQFQEVRAGRRERRVEEEVRHRAVDEAPVVQDPREIGPGEQAALRTRVPFPDGDVIGIEEDPEMRIEGTIARRMRLEQERLEEPGRVGQVPLDRARIRHRLERAILRREPGRQRPGGVADALEPPRRACRVGFDEGRPRRRLARRIRHWPSPPGCREHPSRFPRPPPHGRSLLPRISASPPPPRPGGRPRAARRSSADR